MKIAFLNIYQGKVERGAETFVNKLSINLSKKYDVTVISGNRSPLKRLPILWKSFLDLNGIQVLLWTLKKLPVIWSNKFDVVIPLNGGWQPALVRLVTWLYGGRMIISGQSGKGWDDRNNLWSFPDAFVALSSNLKNWSHKVNPFVRSVHIPNGVDLAQFKAGTKPIDINLPKPVILSVAALQKSKRLDLAMKAVSRIPNTSLLIVGKGEERKILEKLGQNLLHGRFKIIESSFQKMPSVYTAASLFTFPTSSSESFGIAIVEAMASGLPVVATDDPVRREIVGSAGLFVDPTNTDAYANTLQKAIQTKWGNAPRKQAEKYSWEVIATKYEKLFQSLIK